MTPVPGISNKTILVLSLALTALLASEQAGATAFKVLHNFDGSDGGAPAGTLIQDAHGNLYGTNSQFGGNAYGSGVVFKVTPKGLPSVLYSFLGGNDGGNPVAGLVSDAKGNLYGTTQAGGANSVGVVFKLTPSGREIVLHSFSGSPDGANPYGALVTDANGNLYGTTLNGGVNNDGTVFKITPRGRESVLYSFGGAAGDGINPYAGLVMDANGIFYGTTKIGGANNEGIVFRVTLRGKETVLYSFAGIHGEQPVAALITDASGNLYGTTLYGGRDDSGVVFKLTPQGRETVLHSFSGGDGVNPEGSLAIDADGNLYGTTFLGGADMYGTVFKVTPAGKETVLHSFTGGADGEFPRAGLTIDASGNLYGTTWGIYDTGLNKFGAGVYGAVFEITPPTPPETDKPTASSAIASGQTLARR